MNHCCFTDDEMEIDVTCSQRWIDDIDNLFDHSIYGSKKPASVVEYDL